MKTVWGEQLHPESVLQEYPRPQLVRGSYENLNGLWDYAITKTDARPDTWDGKILVPFSPEAELSGVNRTLHPGEILWYRRTLSVPAITAGQRLLLHIGACDQRAKIFCNGPVSAPDGKGEFYSSRIEREVEKVRVCREAVGNDFDFVLEVHRGMTLPEAVAFGRAVEPYRPMILEDPVPPDNVDTMAEVASKVGVPIATGERFIDLREFEVLMARHACQYVRPDVCAVGGITTSKKICALAEAHDVLVIPHNPLGPVSTAACLQICASIPNLGIQELPGFCLNGAEDKMVKEPLRFENGCMLIPEAPGIGVELADDAEELYPANERGSNAARRAFDGSVKDW